MWRKISGVALGGGALVISVHGIVSRPPMVSTLLQVWCQVPTTDPGACSSWLDHSAPYFTERIGGACRIAGQTYK